MSKEFAKIVVNIPLDKMFHYRVPEESRSSIEIGKRVKVSFGRRIMTGYCVGFTDKPEVDDVKDIIRVADESSIVDPKMLQLTRWMANYYHCSWGEALDAILPAGVRKRGKVRMVNFVVALADHKTLMRHARELKIIAPKQSKILRILPTLSGEPTVTELVELAGCSYSSISALVNKGLIAIRRRQVDNEIVPDNSTEPPEPLPLTCEQQKALTLIEEKLHKRNFGVILLHGVTGSGKTEVYLQAIAKSLAQGRQAIVLVPEIALTPQTIRRFSARFDNIAVLHSNLTDKERYVQWQRIRDGKAKVIIGARSAVFAPVKKLGIIVIDEEHENTFKQQDPAPRYHARDVGIVRAKQESAVVVLGSATPSLETYYNSLVKKYDRVTLPFRIGNRPMPTVEIVDMRYEKGFRFISRRLENAMKARLERNEQVILFLNRRGFSTYINCRRCGFVLRCNMCDISLTYHKQANLAICHYCNAEVAPPSDCPDCGMPNIRYFGVGTEKIEEEIRRKFPDKSIVRMDSDSMRYRHAHSDALKDFRLGKTDILLGTQMIAKGLDFPNVTLVGVISADTAMNIPDFRASERTFQLLAQVAGRTGRGDKAGYVIVQSFMPEHYSIQYAAKHDYFAFAEKELEFRKSLNYPPYGRILRIVAYSKEKEKAESKATAIAEVLRSHANQADVQVLGPAPAPIAQIKGKFRFQIIVKAKDAKAIKETLRAVEAHLTSTDAIRVNVDVDPTAML